MSMNIQDILTWMNQATPDDLQLLVDYADNRRASETEMVEGFCSLTGEWGLIRKSDRRLPEAASAYDGHFVPALKEAGMIRQDGKGTTRWVCIPGADEITAGDLFRAIRNH